MVTGHGPSSKTSKTDENDSIFGIGQGATDASTGWLLIATILSKLYDSAANCQTQHKTNTYIGHTPCL